MAEGEAELRHLDQAAHLLQQTGHASLARHVSKTRRMRLEQLDLTGTSDGDVCPRCSTIRIPGETTVIKRSGSQCTACRYMDPRSSVRKPSRALCLSRQKRLQMQRLDTLTSQSMGTASALTGQPRQQQGQDKEKAAAVHKDKEKGKAKSKERKKARQQGLLRAMARSQANDTKQKTKAAGSGLDLSDFML